MISANSGCLTINEYLSEHEEDWWALHELEPGYRREIEDVRVLRRYAASPTTKAVIYTHGPPGESELRVVGPGGRQVWLIIRRYPYMPPLSIIQSILERAEAEGKLLAQM
jgi:hypothetical protein